jgi:hypothetical protein
MSGESEGKTGISYLGQVLDVPPPFVDFTVLPIGTDQPAHMCHRPTYQRTVAVPAFEHTDKPPPSELVGEGGCVLGESVIERCGDFSVVSGHAGVFMFAGIEAAAVQ